VEDQLDWHGKPLGKNSAAALEAVKKEIVNPGPHGIVPEMFVDDCPKVEFPVVKLSEPPKYEMGQKVCNQFLMFLLKPCFLCRLPPVRLMVLHL